MKDAQVSDEGPDGWTGSWCAECGPDVLVDGDGLCMTCGGSAVGPGAERALQIRRERDELTERLS